ncbi:glutathione transferase [Listeria weihenstephanensis FSL R9-0317]|nr:glutathione transferase [Listeria weihenstephanensis FSL R9-0317]
MIKGLYEAHLPVKELDISLDFYKKFDLEVASVSENVAFV